MARKHAAVPLACARRPSPSARCVKSRLELGSLRPLAAGFSGKRSCPPPQTQKKVLERTRVTVFKFAAAEGRSQRTDAMAFEVMLDERDVVLLVMDYLKHREHITAMVALEEETGHQSEDLGKELGFLRKLVLTGDWEAALSFVKPLENSAPHDHTRVIFAVKKQQFLELLEGKDARPELPELVQVLKGIEPLCSGAEFKELCFFLTLSDIREHGDYRAWTATKGRYATFQTMLTVLHPLYGATAPEGKGKGRGEGKSRLVQLLERAVLNQALTVKERNGEPALAATGLDRGEHTIALPLLQDVTVHDISADIVVSAPQGKEGSAVAQSVRPRAVHASIDLSQTQRLPDLQEMNRGAIREKEPSKVDQARKASISAPSPKALSKISKKVGASSAVIESSKPTEITETKPGMLSTEGVADFQNQITDANCQESSVGGVGCELQEMKQVDSEDESDHGGFGDTDQDATPFASDHGNAAPGTEVTAGKDHVEQEDVVASEQDTNSAVENNRDNDAQEWMNSLRAEEEEAEPVRKPVAWTIGFDEESGALERTNSASSRGGREMPVLSTSRPRNRRGDGDGDEGRKSGGLVSAMKVMPSARKNVSTVGRDGETLGKTVKMTHLFNTEEGHSLSDERRDDPPPPKKSLAWVAGMVHEAEDDAPPPKKAMAWTIGGGHPSPANNKARPASARPYLRSSTGTGGGAGGIRASQTRAGALDTHSGSIGRDDAMRRSRDKDDSTADGSLRGDSLRGASLRGVRKPGLNGSSKSPIKSVRARGGAVGELERDGGRNGSGGGYAEPYVDETEAREHSDSYKSELQLEREREKELQGERVRAKGLELAAEAAAGRLRKEQERELDELASLNHAHSSASASSASAGAACGQIAPAAMQAVDVLQDTQVIRTVAWCPDPQSRLLAYGTTSRALRFAEASDVRGVRVVYESPDFHAGSIYAISWQSRGRLLATGSNDKTVQLTRVTQSDSGLVSHTTPLVLQGHTGTVRTVTWCEQLGPAHLASGGAGDCLLRLWDAESMSCVASLSGHHDHIQAMCAASDAPLVASGGKDGQVMLWDLRQQHCAVTFTSAGDEVLSCALNPSDTMLAAGFSDSSCVIWETRMGKQVETLMHHQHQCRSVEYTPDGRWLVTSSFDGTIAYVDVLDGHVEAVLAGHSDRVVQARAHPSQPWMISCSVDKTVRLWC